MVHPSPCQPLRFPCCDGAFIAAADQFELHYNIWSELHGNYFYSLEVSDDEGVQARKLQGDKWGRHWTMRRPKPVSCSWGGLTPEDFGWRMDNYQLKWGVGFRFGHGGRSVCPLYMHLPAARSSWWICSLLLF
jgi:hypothetical protein